MTITKSKVPVAIEGLVDVEMFMGVRINYFRTYNSETQLHDGEYGVLIVDEERSGSHENYNVLFNSDCNYRFFGSKCSAIEYAQSIVKEYDARRSQTDIPSEVQ